MKVGVNRTLWRAGAAACHEAVAPVDALEVVSRRPRVTTCRVHHHPSPSLERPCQEKVSSHRRVFVVAQGWPQRAMRVRPQREVHASVGHVARLRPDARLAAAPVVRVPGAPARTAASQTRQRGRDWQRMGAHKSCGCCQRDERCRRRRAGSRCSSSQGNWGQRIITGQAGGRPAKRGERTGPWP